MVLEVSDSKKESTTTILLKGLLTNWLLNSCVYNHRLVLLSLLTRGTFPHKEQGSCRDFKLSSVSRVSEHSALNGLCQHHKGPGLPGRDGSSGEKCCLLHGKAIALMNSHEPATASTGSTHRTERAAKTWSRANRRGWAEGRNEQNTLFTSITLPKNKQIF